MLDLSRSTLTTTHVPSGRALWLSHLAALALCASCVSSTQTAAHGPANTEASAAGTAAPDPAPDAPKPDAATGEAAPDKDVITLGVRARLTSRILGEERRYLVYTPVGYETGTQRYPVLYLFDGDAHFHHVTGIVSYLSQLGRMPEMLVVGVSNTDRTRDFTPSR